MSVQSVSGIRLLKLLESTDLSKLDSACETIADLEANTRQAIGDNDRDEDARLINGSAKPSDAPGFSANDEQAETNKEAAPVDANAAQPVPTGPRFDHFLQKRAEVCLSGTVSSLASLGEWFPAMIEDPHTKSVILAQVYEKDGNTETAVMDLVTACAPYIVRLSTSEQNSALVRELYKSGHPGVREKIMELIKPHIVEFLKDVHGCGVVQAIPEQGSASHMRQALELVASDFENLMKSRTALSAITLLVRAAANSDLSVIMSAAIKAFDRCINTHDCGFVYRILIERSTRKALANLVSHVLGRTSDGLPRPLDYSRRISPQIDQHGCTLPSIDSSRLTDVLPPPHDSDPSTAGMTLSPNNNPTRVWEHGGYRQSHPLPTQKEALAAFNKFGPSSAAAASSPPAAPDSEQPALALSYRVRMERVPDDPDGFISELGETCAHR
ncbi:hypothetical protein ACM66B_003231 [Microbotryomycetes sp. NB124-2]